MIGIGLESSDALLVATALGVLALTLFLLATWLGRWPLWVVGWVFAILAVSVALFSQLRSPPATAPAAPAGPIVMERSAGLGAGLTRPCRCGNLRRAASGAVDAGVTNNDYNGPVAGPPPRIGTAEATGRRKAPGARNGSEPVGCRPCTAEPVQPGGREPGPPGI